MLLSIEFENSGSFQTPQDFNLARVPRFARRASLRAPESSWNFDYSPVVAVFGANAAGKSNLIRAINSATKAFKADSLLEAVQNFRNSAEVPGNATRFSVQFLAPNPDGENWEFVYSFAVSPIGVVEEEELRVYPRIGAKSKRVFHRVLDVEATTKEKYVYRLAWGSQVRGEKALALRLTDADELVLSQSHLLDSPEVDAAVEWFETGISFFHANGYVHELDRIKRRMGADPQFRDKVASYLREADLGIVGLELVVRSEDEIAAFRDFLHGRGEYTLDETEQMVETYALSLAFVHSGDTPDDSFLFHQYQESDGTVAMLAFASIAIDALETGATIVVDEIDMSLHPLLVRGLIKQFNSPESNPHQAQLIFTTHDVTLLYTATGESSLLERDQIWLVEKSGNGRSELYALAEFPARDGENIFRKYLSGQYGSVPRPSLDGVFFSVGEE